MKRFMVIILMFFVLAGCDAAENTDGSSENADTVENETVEIEETEQQTEKEEDVVEDSIKTIVIGVDVLNIRSDATITSEILGKALLDQKLDVYETKNDENDKTWYRIRLDNNSAWIAGWFCYDASVEPQTLSKLYTEPGSSASLYAIVPTENLEVPEVLPHQYELIDNSLQVWQKVGYESQDFYITMPYDASRGDDYSKSIVDIHVGGEVISFATEYDDHTLSIDLESIESGKVIVSDHGAFTQTRWLVDAVEGVKVDLGEFTYYSPNKELLITHSFNIDDSRIIDMKLLSLKGPLKILWSRDTIAYDEYHFNFHRNKWVDESHFTITRFVPSKYAWADINHEMKEVTETIAVDGETVSLTLEETDNYTSDLQFSIRKNYNELDENIRIYEDMTTFTETLADVPIDAVKSFKFLRTFELIEGDLYYWFSVETIDGMKGYTYRTDRTEEYPSVYLYHPLTIFGYQPIILEHDLNNMMYDRVDVFKGVSDYLIKHYEERDDIFSSEQVSLVNVHSGEETLIRSTGKMAEFLLSDDKNHFIALSDSHSEPDHNLAVYFLDESQLSLVFEYRIGYQSILEVDWIDDGSINLYVQDIITDEKVRYLIRDVEGEWLKEVVE